MKKSFFIFIAILCFISTIFANEDSEKKETSFVYGAVGANALLLLPFPLPYVGLGFRGHHRWGVDLSFSAYPYIAVNGIALSGSLLYFTKNNYYAGIGAKGGCFWGALDESIVAGFLNLTLGKEFSNKYNKKRFIELEVGPPPYSDHFCWSDHHKIIYPSPLIGLKYSFSF